MRITKILKRILTAVPIMLGIALIVFAFMRIIPGDPVDIIMGQSGGVSQSEVQALREEFNLDKPLHIQLYYFLSGLVRGDLGTSFTYRRPVWDLIMERLPATIELALGALLFALSIGVPIGVVSSVRQRSALDRASMAGAFLGISMPEFWLGIVLIVIFSVHARLLPVFGRGGFGFEPAHITGLYTFDSLLTGDFSNLKSSLRHLILPSVALGAPLAAIVARVLRSSMLEVLRQEYITTARAKGLAEPMVIIRHAMRNGLIPTVTVVGLQLGSFMGGNMVVETVFAWPGIGRLVVDAIFARDFPLVQGAVILYAFTFVMANLIVDVLYTVLNPKIDL
jgi:peptide/nickel transport system permease protein